MDDMKALVKILAAFKASEDNGVDSALFDEKTLGMTEKERDRHIQRLVKAGYVDGIRFFEMDGLRYPVVNWPCSDPMITIAGIEFISGNSTFRKAVDELKNAGIQIASGVLQNTIMSKM